MLIQSTVNYHENKSKIVVTGKSGVGKTSLAKTCDNALVYSIEGGLLSLSGSKVDYIDGTKDQNGELLPIHQRWDKLFEFFSLIQTEEIKNKYETIILDSLTEISQCLVEKLSLEYPDKKDAFPMWGEYNKQVTAMVKAFRDLPYYNVVFLALDSINEDENKRRYVGVQMSGSIAQRLPQFFDEVFYMYADDDGNRFFQTGATDKIMAKDRSGKLDKIEEANLGHIFNKIKGEKNV